MKVLVVWLLPDHRKTNSYFLCLCVLQYPYSIDVCMQSKICVSSDSAPTTHCVVLVKRSRMLFYFFHFFMLLLLSRVAIFFSSVQVGSMSVYTPHTVVWESYITNSLKIWHTCLKNTFYSNQANFWFHALSRFFPVTWFTVCMQSFPQELVHMSKMFVLPFWYFTQLWYNLKLATKTTKEFRSLLHIWVFLHAKEKKRKKYDKTRQFLILITMFGSITHAWTHTHSLSTKH